MNPTRAREAPASVGGQILIIDGADDARCRLVGALEREGHTVVTADAGDEAARWLAELDFDAVLSDVLMPGSGDPAVAAVGVISPGTEVVILGGDDEDAAIEAVRGGAFDVLTRPVHAARLIASIARAVEHRRLKAAGALYELSQIMFDARDAEHLPGMIVGVTMRVMGADDVSLMLPDADMNLHIAHSCGLGADVQREARIGLGERVAGRVARDLTPALLHRELDTDPRFQGVANFRRIRSSIVYPVVAQGRLLAVLNMNRISLARPFHRADLARAGVLASKVALALENAELVRRLVAAERFATVGQIASSVVHEINNPLAAVLTGLAFAVEQLASIVDAPADGPVADALAAAEDALTGAERVREIVRDVRALARKDDPATRDVFDLAGPIRSAVRTIGRCHPGRGVTVGAQVEDGVRILGSEGSMGQVFTNLLANAMQAINDSSEASGRIDVVARREGDRAIVDVIDSGPGIAEENMPRLFEPLFTTKPGDRGTGLGLFISREIVERHGGDIGVRKAPGRGTIFTIRLPLAG